MCESILPFEICVTKIFHFTHMIPFAFLFWIFLDASLLDLGRTRNEHDLGPVRTEPRPATSRAAQGRGLTRYVGNR